MQSAGACFNPALYQTGTTYSVTWNVNKSNTQADGRTFYNSTLYEVTEDYTVLGTAIFNGHHAIRVGVVVTPGATGTSERLEHGGAFEAYYAIPDFIDIWRGQIRYLGSEVDLGDGFEPWETVNDARIVDIDGNALAQTYTLMSRKTVAGGNWPNPQAAAMARPKHTQTIIHEVLEGIDEILPEHVDWRFPVTNQAGQVSVLPPAIPRGGEIPGPMDVCKITGRDLTNPSGTRVDAGAGPNEPFLYRAVEQTLSHDNDADIDPNTDEPYGRRQDLYMFLSKDTGLPVYVEYVGRQTGLDAFSRFRMVRAYINGELVHGEEPEEP